MNIAVWRHMATIRVDRLTSIQQPCGCWVRRWTGKRVSVCADHFAAKYRQHMNGEPCGVTVSAFGSTTCRAHGCMNRSHHALHVCARCGTTWALEAS